MSLLPADPARRNAVLAALLALSSIYFAYTYVHGPAVEDREQSERRISSLKEWNSQAAEKAGSDAGLGPRLARYQEHAARLERVVATERELGGLRDVVSREARAAGAEVAFIRLLSREADEFFELQGYEARVTGDYHAIGRFATAVASLERIVVPVVVAIIPADGPSGTDSGQVVADLELFVPVFVPGKSAVDAGDPAEEPLP